jgi:hypothetical protein
LTESGDRRCVERPMSNRFEYFDPRHSAVWENVKGEEAVTAQVLLSGLRGVLGCGLI